MKRWIVTVAVVAAAIGLLVWALTGRETPKKGATVVKADPRTAGPPAVPDQIDAMPEDLAVLMATGKETGFVARSSVIRKLDRRLTDEEINALYSLMRRKKEEDELSAADLTALKIDILEVLKTQKTKPESLVRELIAMYFYDGHDSAWRSHCVRQIGALYGNLADEETRGAARDALSQALSNEQGDIVGAALKAVRENCDQEGFGRDRIGAKAVAISADAESPNTLRQEAFRVCAKLGEARALPAAREAATSSTDTSLRIAAVSAIGRLGDASDRLALQKLVESEDPHLSNAAKSALRKVGARPQVAVPGDR